MFKKSLLIFYSASSLFSTSLFGLDLKQTIVESLNTNPIIDERLKNYRATQQDLNIAESGYYPQLDLRASFGYTNAGVIKNVDAPDEDRFNHNVADSESTNYETSLAFTQNLFNGFGTMHMVDYQEARVLASAYKYLEVSNDMAYRMTSAYVNVLSSHALAQTAKENVLVNEATYLKVKELFDSGLTTDSEVKKIQSSLSLARSNLTVQKNNARDAQYTFRRVLGRMPILDDMQRPDFDIVMPESIEEAALYSVEHNPSLLVSRYNIKGAQALYKQRKKEYFPKVDLEVSQFYNDSSRRNTFDSPDDRFRARLVLNYNLFRGGADKANIQKHLSLIAQEIEIKRDLKRQVIEGLDLSWNAYEMIGKQLKDLREYSKFSEETLALYEEEYDLGRRSLLDLLSSQNDVINSRSQIITAEFAHLYAKYRILDAMGLLVTAIAGDTKEFTSKVNLHSDSAMHEILDTLPVKLDVDNDNISDNLDLCDNSLKDNNIMPYGCKKIIRDSDKDGVVDAKDSCLMTPLNAKISQDGCALDSDSDGIKDYEDKCLNTPDGYAVNQDGCVSTITIEINFLEDSSKIQAHLAKKISKFALFMKNNPDFQANVIGHTSRTDVSKAEYNLKLSKRRAEVFKNELIKYGIGADRITIDGKGFDRPIADNSTSEGRSHNRRVEIELNKLDAE